MNRRRLLFALVLAGQLVVLYAPRTPSSGGVPGVDKVVHVTVFALVVWAGLRAGVARPLVLLVSVVHAPVSELLQATLLSNRSGEPLDVVADLLGCALGWLTAGWLAARRDMMVR